MQKFDFHSAGPGGNSFSVVIQKRQYLGGGPTPRKNISRMSLNVIHGLATLGHIVNWLLSRKPTEIERNFK